MSEKQERLGTIFLNIEHENLYESLNGAFLGQISDFMRESESSRCLSESYIV